MAGQNRTIYASISAMLDRNSGTEARDAVSEVLLGMRLRGASYWRLRLSSPYGIDFPASDDARFHFVGQGHALLVMAGRPPHPLGPGDAVLIPRGHAHQLLSAEDVPARDFDSYTPEQICAVFGDIRDCDSAQCRTRDTTILTGRMEMDLATMHPLIGLMPEAMPVGALLEREPEVPRILHAMEVEMSRDRPGSVGVLARLADAVAALILRGWIECGCDAATGVMAALKDARLARVLVELHKDPARDWDVAGMAALMGASRSVFSERFTAVVGVSPQRYVTELKMWLGAEWLSRDGLPVAEVAHRLGYGSQAAFARAFRRIVGRPPAAHRRDAREKGLSA